MNGPDTQNRQRLARGTVLDSRFEIIAYLGSGKFSDVYLARQMVFGFKLREVALKLFHPDKISKDNFSDVFSEAVTVIRLQEEDPLPEISRHLIGVFDIGLIESPSAQAYMSMQYIPGGKNQTRSRTLQHEVERWANAGGMPLATSLMYLRQILVPLAWMHTLPTPAVHGDLKPDNILVAEGSRLVLTDFGLAARLPMASLGGAIQYQAWETLAGGGAKEPADIYGIGLTWYEMLTGRHPFRDVGLEALGSGDEQAFVHAHLQSRKWEMRPACGDPSADARRIPLASETNEDMKEHPQLEAILQRCFARSPADRYPNARLLLNDVQKYIETGQVDVPSPVFAGYGEPLEDGEVVLGPETVEKSLQDVKSLLDTGRDEEALARAEAAVRENPKSLPALLTHARILAAAKGFEKARQACHKARQLAPRDPDCLTALAEVHEAEGRPDLAHSWRQQAKSMRDRLGRKG